jgi:PAS domain S-box-containing protein
MDNKYKILLVEDDINDAELNIREIKKVLPDSVFMRVDEKKSFIDHLKKFKPDLIISDYNMPVFDGLAALHIATEICPSTPFIIVTGSINEDTAVECMKSGATDYVLKDSLKRLGSAIIGALKQRDIKLEKIRTEKMLVDSEQSYLGLFNSVSEAIYILNSQSVFISVNNGCLKMYDYSLDELIGKNPEYLSAPNMNDLVKIAEIINHVFETGITQQFEFWGKRKNGDIFPKEVICSKGIYFGQDVIIATARDITERRQAVENLQRERKLLRLLIDNLPVTIYVKDSECRKVIANKADLEVIGVETEEEVLGKTDLETFGSEIGKRGYLDDKIVIESGIPVLNREEDFLGQDGKERWILTSKIPITDENGQSLGLVGIGRDITEQKLAQAKILKLSKGIEQSPSTIVITDLDGNIEYVNPQFCQATGYTEAEAIGKNPRILKSGFMPDQVYTELWNTIKAGNVWRGEMENKRKDGSLYWESATITGIKNEKGIITNYIAIKEDITERKKMQEELIASKEKAEESDRLKSAFLANMSHEIRTPLNSIIGFSELLGDPDFEEEQRNEFISTIIDNGNSLLTIISDIMDFSMLEARQIKIRAEEISVKKLMIDLIIDFKKRALRKGIELRLDQSENSQDQIIESDVYRIKQVFNNLISNAIKFTDSGYIELGFRIQEDLVEFKVRDTGIGILPKFHNAIFDRFRQIDTAKTRKYGGNGLGLAISKNMVELLGGKIWLESEYGKYSDFYFTVPFKTKSTN